jgi:hypothetical protein
MLDPAGLKDNGGLTPTIALLPGSPAIDAGSNSVPNLPATDQRGFARPDVAGTNVDIGAFEFQPVQLPPPPSASVAFGPAGAVVELVNSEGVLTQFDATGAHQLGNGGVRYASIAFGPNGDVLEIVSTAGVLTQFDATGAHRLGGGVQSASVAFGPNGEVLEVISSTGVLTQFSAAGAQQLGGSGVESAGVAFTANSEVLDIIFSDGSLNQFDASGQHRLGMVS